MNGAELTIQLLERQGITRIAGIPGGANLPLYDALARRGTIGHVLVRQEQAAGFIAQGMARVTGKAAVCFATSGPGATNMLTAIADAKLDSIPVVCITGQVPQSLIGTDAFQEVDVFGISLPVTKHNYLVKSAEDLLRIIPEAFEIALSGRPGPVWIDIPKDVQLQQIEVAEWPEPGARLMPTEPDGAEIEAAARMIARSRRPILYLGGGIVHAGASEAARAFAEKLSLPTVTTLMALGTIPNAHPLNLGMLGMHGAPFTNLAIEDSDLLIAVGARFDDRATGKVAEFCPNAAVIHIDIDRAEFGKIRTPTLSIQGDALQCLNKLLEANIARVDPMDWVEHVNTLRRDHPMAMPGIDDPLTPYGIIHAAARAAGPDAIVSTDVGQHQMWTAQAYPFNAPRRLLTSGGLGTMGFGLPAAIGAALAAPEKTVVCISGDGSFLMNNQELVTAAEERLNVKILVLDNQTLGLVHQQQTLLYEKRLFASKFQNAVNFAALAEALCVRGIDLADAADPEQTLADAMQQPGPALIRVPIDAEEQVLPMVPPGAANRDMIREKPLSSSGQRAPLRRRSRRTVAHAQAIEAIS